MSSRVTRLRVYGDHVFLRGSQSVSRQGPSGGGWSEGGVDVQRVRLELDDEVGRVFRPEGRTRSDLFGRCLYGGVVYPFTDFWRGGVEVLDGLSRGSPRRYRYNQGGTQGVDVWLCYPR